MGRKTDKSLVVDGLLRMLALGTITGTALIAPNGLQILDKPLQAYFKKFDKKQREREYRKMLAYMHRYGLVTKNYSHGLEITDKARKRLERAHLDQLQIVSTSKWDKKWRIIFYDIPEHKKAGRDQLAFKLRQLGCQQLQRSVWIHPYPCEEVVDTVALAHGIESHITYVETVHISNEESLVQRFSHLLL